ncbi:MAG: hypothetical protein JJE50_10830 [Actinomycetales bacterium]|nr:hypothetical protein [Actinomycetales bacterium]
MAITGIGIVLILGTGALLVVGALIIGLALSSSSKKKRNAEAWRQQYDRGSAGQVAGGHTADSANPLGPGEGGSTYSHAPEGGGANGQGPEASSGPAASEPLHTGPVLPPAEPPRRIDDTNVARHQIRPDGNQPPRDDGPVYQ